MPLSESGEIDPSAPRCHFDGDDTSNHQNWGYPIVQTNPKDMWIIYWETSVSPVDSCPKMTKYANHVYTWKPWLGLIEYIQTYFLLTFFESHYRFYSLILQLFRVNTHPYGVKHAGTTNHETILVGKRVTEHHLSCLNQLHGWWVNDHNDHVCSCVNCWNFKRGSETWVNPNF